jgi:hypothetical protein
MGGKGGGFGSLIIALGFAGYGAWAYTHDYVLVLFGVVELTPVAFAIIAVVLFTVAVIQLLPKGRGRRNRSSSATEQMDFQGHVNAAAQRAETIPPMAAPATVNVAAVGQALAGGVKVTVALNGQTVGELREHGVVSVYTPLAQNMVSLLDQSTGKVVDAPFTAWPGGLINLAIERGATGLLVDQR